MAATRCTPLQRKWSQATDGQSPINLHPILDAVNVACRNTSCKRLYSGWELPNREKFAPALCANLDNREHLCSQESKQMAKVLHPRTKTANVQATAITGK